MIKTGDIRCTCGSNDVIEIGCDLDKNRYRCNACGRSWWLRNPPENVPSDPTPER